MKRVLALFAVLSIVSLPGMSHAQVNAPQVTIIGCQTAAVAGCPTAVHRSVYIPGDSGLPDDGGQGVTTLYMPFDGNLSIRNVEPDAGLLGAACTSTTRNVCHTLTSVSGYKPGTTTSCTTTFANVNQTLTCEPIFDSVGSSASGGYDAIGPVDEGHIEYGDKFSMGKGTTSFTFHCLIHPTMTGKIRIVCTNSSGCRA